MKVSGIIPENKLLFISNVGISNDHLEAESKLNQNKASPFVGFTDNPA